ncbi:hypothetical protein Hanom_Chr10g00887581 [Helianthus anomalus]
MGKPPVLLGLYMLQQRCLGPCPRCNLIPVIALSVNFKRNKRIDINIRVKCHFRPKICISASGSKRFEILPFSVGSLTPSIFLH